MRATSSARYLTYLIYLINTFLYLTGNAGASGPDASEMMEDGAITDENAGRERKTSRDSERSCPSLPKKKKVIEIIDTALEASWNEIFTFFIDHLKDLKSVNGIQAIPYLQVSLIILLSGVSVLYHKQ